MSTLSTDKTMFSDEGDLALEHGECKTAAEVCKPLRPCGSILFLVDQLTELGGGERVLFELARELPKKGFRVAVATFRDLPDPASFLLCNNITLLPFRSCFSRQAIRVAVQLRHLIRTQQVDIVQTSFETSDTFGALVARLAGVRHVISSRRDMGILRTAKHRIAYRLLGGSYSAIIAVSDGVRQKHVAIDHLRSERVHTIYNGLNLDRFRLNDHRDATRRMLHLPSEAPLVTTVANVNAWKGLDIFLKAAAVIHAKLPSAHFAIAGDWTDRELVASLQALAVSLGVSHHCHLLGRVADVPSLLLASDLFALLSRSEGFPNAVLEAMAAGLPVVATAVGGTPEAIYHGQTGFLVANEDAAGAAEHLIALLSDEPLRRRMGDAGRERVERQFSTQTMVDKHVELYDALLSDSR